MWHSLNNILHLYQSWFLECSVFTVLSHGFESLIYSVFLSFLAELVCVTLLFGDTILQGGTAVDVATHELEAQQHHHPRHATITMGVNR